MSIYENLLSRFFVDQSVLSLIHQSCHIYDCWAGTGKESLIFVNWKKNRESRGKQEYGLKHLGVMGVWKWFFQVGLSVSVPVFGSWRQECQRFQFFFQFLTIFLTFTKICFCSPPVWTWGTQAPGIKIRVTEKEKEHKVLGILTRTEWRKGNSYLRERLLHLES